jgi:hypothetical protein
MKNVIVPVLVVLAVFGTVIALAVYRAPPSDKGERADASPAPSSDSWSPTGRWGPDKHGVVCYRYLQGVACVKVE